MTKDQLDRLERLSAFRAGGVITQREFESQKAALLSEDSNMASGPAHADGKVGYRWGPGRILLALIGIPALLLLIFRVVGGGAAVTALQGGKVPAHVAVIPAPHLHIDEVKVDDSCARLGDYCVRVTCTVTNDGNAGGPVSLEFEYKAPGRPTATATETATVPVGGQRVVSHDFGEARLADHDSKGSCGGG